MFVPLLPFFNLLVFFIRLAGVINSINTDSAWKTRTLSEEQDDFSTVVRNDMSRFSKTVKKIRASVNMSEGIDMYGKKG